MEDNRGCGRFLGGGSVRCGHQEDTDHGITHTLCKTCYETRGLVRFNRDVAEWDSRMEWYDRSCKRFYIIIFATVIVSIFGAILSYLL